MTSFYLLETSLTTKSKSIVLTFEVCGRLLVANQHHAGSSQPVEAPTSVHAKLHAGQQKLGRMPLKRVS